jgi:hypothetical protein
LKGLGIAVPASLAFMFLLSMASPAVAANTASITLTPSAAVVGNRISVTGQGYSPNTELTLEWSTVDASWVVSGNPPKVTGLNATPIESRLLSVATNSFGSFSANLTVPSDYGGQHVIQALASNGTALSGRAIFTLEPSFVVSPTSGPAGTPIKVAATGLGYGLYSTSYHLYWDNSYAGYFTAVSSKGSTNFTFYASGTPGTYYVEIYQGYPGPGYLNPQQGPPSSETQSEFPPYIPFHAEFNITGSHSSGSIVVPSLVVLAAAMTSLGLFVYVVRVEPEKRSAIGRTLGALLIIIAIASAGVGTYIALTPTSAAMASYTPQATVVRPPITVPQNNVTAGPRISVTPNIASVGQNITVSGAGFAPSSDFPLSWSTRKGSNLLGYELVNRPLRNVTAGSDGTFSFVMEVPPDLGGIHYISAANLTTNSNATLFVQRTAAINATEGPSGTTVAIVMTGVGWTFNTNIAAFDYDNSYLGYGCGFNSGGNVTFYVTITGAPGVHSIDVYPSVWWGPSGPADQLAVEYRYPLLTPQDHPELMPSFHFAFLITGAGSHSQTSGDVLAPRASLGLAAMALVRVASPTSAPRSGDTREVGKR